MHEKYKDRENREKARAIKKKLLWTGGGEEDKTIKIRDLNKARTEKVWIQQKKKLTNNKIVKIRVSDISLGTRCLIE